VATSTASTSSSGSAATNLVSGLQSIATTVLRCSLCVKDEGVYTVNGVDVIAEAGDVVVIPANAWHCFRGDGEVPLRHVAIFEHAHDIGMEWKPT
jgi:gentisate 1,2-dioxygenase